MKLLSKVNRSIYKVLPSKLQKIADTVDKNPEPTEHITDVLFMFIFISVSGSLILMAVFPASIISLGYVSYLTFKTIRDNKNISFGELRRALVKKHVQ